MHELSVCQGLMRQIETLAREHAARAVSKITLRIGPLSGVEPHLLQQAFPLASAGSMAEAAALVIESLPVRVRCRECGAESEAKPNQLICKQCGAWKTQLLSGDELLLASVELETEPELSKQDARQLHQN